MALHQKIQRLLLLGIRLEAPFQAPVPTPPQRLVMLIEAVAIAHQKFDERAVHFGHRYRSGFWSIYLLSASPYCARYCRSLSVGTAVCTHCIRMPACGRSPRSASSAS